MLAVHQTPREGLEHPLFAELAPTDHLILRVYFAARLDDEQYEKTDGVIQKWMETTPWEKYGGAPAITDQEESRIDLYLRLGGVARPVEPLKQLLASYTALGIRFQELFAARWTRYDERGLMGPVGADGKPASGRADFRDQAEYMRYVWDHGAGPVASENDLQLKGVLELNEGKLALEQRGHVLHVPGVRIGFGILEDYVRVPGDARTDEVEGAIREALEESFAGVWSLDAPEPTPLMSSFARERGRVDTVVTAIGGAPRRGYEMMWFAEPLRVRVRQAFRQREPEILEALGAVIRKLGLDPVITWIRVGLRKGPAGPMAEPFKYYFQLWERPSVAVAVPPAPEPIAWPPASVESFYDQWLSRRGGRLALRRTPRADAALLGRIHGARFAPDLARFLELRDVRSLNGQVIGALELDDAAIRLHDVEEAKLVEALLQPRRHLMLRLSFAGMVPIGTLSQSGAEVVASVLPEAKTDLTPILGISDRHGGFHLADGVGALLAAAEAMQRNDRKTGAELLAGRVSGDLELKWLGAAPLKSCGHSQRYFRAFWIYQLLGLLYAESVDQIVENMKDLVKSQLKLDRTLAAGNQRFSAPALYVLWTAYFVDDPRLPQVLDACAAVASPLVRGMAALVREVLGGRKEVGPIEDLHARRAEFIARAEASAPEALAQLRT